MRESHERLAGPVIRSGDMAEAAMDAVIEDNPDKEVKIVDHNGYVRIEAPGGLVLRRETMEEYLGRSFVIQEIEKDLISFSGQIELTDDQARWYFLTV